MLRIPRIALSSILICYVAFCGCDPAAGKNVPAGFDRDNFEEIVRYSISEYLQPRSIDLSRAYVGAGESALKSMPYPLVLLSKEFYEQREKVLAADRVVPGKAIFSAPGKPYVIFEPDYVALEKQNKAARKRESTTRKQMSEEERSQLFLKTREQLKREDEWIEKAWARVSFTQRDFYDIADWIDSNKEKYSKPPSTFKGENIYERDPFGMHHVYFAAINGFMQAMDPHSGILDKASWTRIRTESQDSSFEGIGALLRGGGHQEVVVETPLPGSPALNAGLRAGDIIRKVDNKPIDSLPLSEVVKAIRGPKDTVVALYVERPLELRHLTVRIKRGLIELKAVSSHYLKEEQVGVIKISSFLYKSEPPTYLVRREYKRLLKESNKQLKGIVIDLRNNPGGDLSEAINTTGLFLPKGEVVVIIKDRSRSDEKRNPSKPMIPMKGKFPAIPIIVLQNAGSASASEIFASALMDHDAALIVGDRSFGKASVQGVQPWGDVIIKLTTARYFAPRDYTIQVYGVQPDIKVSDEPDGSFPPRFREEDMWKHLPELDTRKARPARQAWIARLNAAVGNNAAAEKYLSSHKNDALKPDYMLRRALSYLEAMRRYPHP